MSVSETLLLGFEIGGTKLQLGLGRADGRILALERRVIRPEAGAQGILAQILEAYRSLLAHSGIVGQFPSALGIGFGGPVDAERGLILRSHQVDGWESFDLSEWSRSALKIRNVAIQNDADAAGLGEASQGAGVGLSPIFYVTIGSGIGGGLILGGEIYRGSGLGAAEIGHLWIDDVTQGPMKLEDIASGWAIGRAGRMILEVDKSPGPLLDIVNGDPSLVDGLVVARSAQLGDARALTILATATRSIGRALAHLVTLVAPRRIILGGGVSRISEELWLEPIRRALEARVFPPFRGSYDVVNADLGEEVVIHGALEIARKLV